MKNNILKIVLLSFIFIFILLSNFGHVYAYSISDIFTDADDFVHAGNEVGEMIDRTALKNTSSFIYRLLFSIGLVVAIAVGIVLGIQFMLASATDKAKIKETLIGYVVGCVVLFGAYRIWAVVINIVKETTSVSTEESTCAHIWDHEATCDNPAHCTSCGKEKTVSHRYRGNATCITPKVCSECNHEVMGTHNYVGEPTCITPAVCSECNKELTGTHNFPEGISCQEMTECIYNCGEKKQGSRHFWRVEGEVEKCKYCGTINSLIK